VRAEREEKEEKIGEVEFYKHSKIVKV